MPDIDESVERLRAFNGLLERIQPALHSLAGELDGLSHQLAGDEPGVRDGLAALASEVTDLAKAATDSATDAAHAAEDLDTHLRQLLDSSLPAIEQQATQSKEQLQQSLQEQAKAVDAGLGTLQFEAFEPFDTVLGQRQTDFSAWADQADGAINPLGEEILEAIAEVTTGVAQLATDISGATASVETDKSDFGATKWETQKVDDKLPTDFEHAIASLQDEVHTLHSSMTDIWSGDLAIASQFNEPATAAVKAVEEAIEHAIAAVGTATQSISQLDEEVERDAVLAESDQVKRVTVIAALAPQIAEAEQNVVEIREILQAMVDL